MADGVTFASRDGHRALAWPEAQIADIGLDRRSLAVELPLQWQQGAGIKADGLGRLDALAAARLAGMRDIAAIAEVMAEANLDGLGAWNGLAACPL